MTHMAGEKNIHACIFDIEFVEASHTLIPGSLILSTSQPQSDLKVVLPRVGAITAKEFMQNQRFYRTDGSFELKHGSLFFDEWHHDEDTVMKYSKQNKSDIMAGWTYLEKEEEYIIPFSNAFTHFLHDFYNVFPHKIMNEFFYYLSIHNSLAWRAPKEYVSKGLNKMDEILLDKFYCNTLGDIEVCIKPFNPNMWKKEHIFSISFVLKVLYYPLSGGFGQVVLKSFNEEIIV